MKVLNSVGLSKKDMVNMVTNSVSYQSAIGQRITVRGLAICESVDKDNGEVKTVSYVVGDDGTVYGGNSSVVIDAVSNIIDYMIDEPDEVIIVEPVTFKTKSDRDCVTLKLI